MSPKKAIIRRTKSVRARDGKVQNGWNWPCGVIFVYLPMLAGSIGAVADWLTS